MCTRTCVCVRNNPSLGAVADMRLILSGLQQFLNSDIIFLRTGCHIKAKEPSLDYSLPIPGGRIVGFISFPKFLALPDLQSCSEYELGLISYDANYYTSNIYAYTHTYICIYECINIYIYIYIYIYLYIYIERERERAIELCLYTYIDTFILTYTFLYLCIHFCIHIYLASVKIMGLFTYNVDVS